MAQAIGAQQKLFLEFGPLAMKPLGLREVDEEVGVHASTVSRTVHGKATPFGVFELRRFFSRGLDHASASAATAMKGLIHEIVTAEIANAP